MRIKGEIQGMKFICLPSKEDDQVYVIKLRVNKEYVDVCALSYQSLISRGVDQAETIVRLLIAQTISSAFQNLIKGGE